MIDLRQLLPIPASAKADIVANVGVNQSPFTGGEQAIELPGARWLLTYGYEKLVPSQSRLMKTIKAMLRSGAEIATIRDFSYVPSFSAVAGVPVINGAGQQGNALQTSGWDADVAVLAFGDQVSYLGTDGLYRMHVVTQAAVSDSFGNALLPIMPAIRNPPADGEALECLHPCLSVRLSDGGEVSAKGMQLSCSFEFSEALYGIL